MWIKRSCWYLRVCCIEEAFKLHLFFAILDDRWRAGTALIRDSVHLELFVSRRLDHGHLKAVGPESTELYDGGQKFSDFLGPDLASPMTSQRKNREITGISPVHCNASSARGQI